MKKRIYLLIILIIITVITANAQFSISGEIRPRAEFRNGFKKLNSDQTEAAFFIEQRSRLNFNFVDSTYEFRLSLQDVRLWGENSQIFKGDNSLFNVYEAWGQYNFGKKTSIKVGRQTLDYDNARFLGNLGWAQQSRSHDLMKFRYKTANNYGAPGHFEIHIGAAFNQEDVNGKSEPARLSSTFYSGVNNYKTMQFAWLHKNYGKGSFSFLLLNNGVQAADSSVHFSQTAGLFTKNKLGSTNLVTEAYYQYGSDPTGANLRAYLLSLNLGFKISNTTLTLGGDVLSGTEAGSNTNNSFNPLYGTNHKFYGLMDYFYVGNPHGNVGLIDLYLKTKFKLGEKSALLAHAHQFLSQTSVVASDNSTRSSILGTEVDLVYNLNIEKGVNFKVGYSQLFATSSMEELKGGDSNALNQWAWVMFTIKPVLFKN